MKKKIAYILLILMLAIVFIWTNKLFTLWILGAMIVLLIPVIILNRISAKKISVEFDILNELSENPELLLKIENKSGFPVSGITVKFRCENVVFSTSYDTSVSCSVGRKSVREYKFPISSVYCGQINVDISDIFVYDYFGLTKRKIQQKKGCKFYEYPSETENELMDFEGNLVSDNDIQYKHVKGNDISEILQMKEYMQGDSIKNIHWKMSAKMGKTMVKELDTPNDNSVMVCFDYAEKENKVINQKIIEAVASVSRELITNTTGHTVYRMNTKENRVVHRGVFEISEYDIMLQEILETEAVCNEYRVLDYVIERGVLNRYAKVIYITYAANKSGAAELEAQDKCLVLYVD